MKISRRDALTKGARATFGIIGLHLLRFTSLPVPAVNAISSGPSSIRLLASGSGLSNFGVWAGRGCSAMATGLQALGFESVPDSAVDFSKDTVLAITGVDQIALTVDPTSAAIVAQAGTGWAIYAIPSFALGADWAVQFEASRDSSPTSVPFSIET